MMIALRIVARGLRFPEGPIAMPDGSVILVEIEGGRLTRVLPDGSKTTIAQLGGGPNGAALGPDGKVYVCNNGGLAWQEDEHGLRAIGTPADDSGGRIERVDLHTGEIELLYDRTEHGPFRGPNDIVFDRHGGFWFTDAGKVAPRHIYRGAVYYGRSDGTCVREVIFPMLQANGIGLSASEERLFVSETITGRVWAFDVVAPGEIRRAPFPSPNGGHLLAGVSGYQLFDSLAIDSAGNICVATMFNGGISVIAPDGALLEHVPMPDYLTTNICFGGQNLTKAYITLGSTGMLVEMDWPRPGQPLNFAST